MKPNRQLSTQEQNAALMKELEALWALFECMVCETPCEHILCNSDALEKLLAESGSMVLAGNRFGTKRAKHH
ncbi:MAG: hypothetical protein HQL43_09195 [Alphaproteobacteria bacterium]|nr:hypothetical protein [Alphaproteobacteria bacterium]